MCAPSLPLPSPLQHPLGSFRVACAEQQGSRECAGIPGVAMPAWGGKALGLPQMKRLHNCSLGLFLR